MPNRMLRDWTNSDKINSLDAQAERFFVRLIMKADDFGCFYADERLLKANLFPLLLDGVRGADISRWMAACQKAGLIVSYEANSKKYLQIVDFRQRLDKAKNKFPLPPADFPEFVNDFPAEVEVETEGKPKPKPKPKRETETVDFKKIIYPFESENFMKNWENWKEYKSAEHRFKFKSPQSEQASLKELVKLSNGRENAAIEIILQSMANGWKGFFELKNQKNGKFANKNEQSTGAGVDTASAFAKIDLLAPKT